MFGEFLLLFRQFVQLLRGGLGFFGGGLRVGRLLLSGGFGGAFGGFLQSGRGLVLRGRGLLRLVLAEVLLRLVLVAFGVALFQRVGGAFQVFGLFGIAALLRLLRGLIQLLFQFARVVAHLRLLPALHFEGCLLFGRQAHCFCSAAAAA